MYVNFIFISLFTQTTGQSACTDKNVSVIIFMLILLWAVFIIIIFVGPYTGLNIFLYFNFFYILLVHWWPDEHNIILRIRCPHETGVRAFSAHREWRVRKKSKRKSFIHHSITISHGLNDNSNSSSSQSVTLITPDRLERILDIWILLPTITFIPKSFYNRYTRVPRRYRSGFLFRNVRDKRLKT